MNRGLVGKNPELNPELNPDMSPELNIKFFLLFLTYPDLSCILISRKGKGIKNVGTT
jgi:hypothetical protein